MLGVKAQTRPRKTKPKTKPTWASAPAQAVREQIVTAALEWVGTPYVPGGTVKGAGTDCGMYLLEVFKACGCIPPEFDPRPYPSQWHMHQSAERYLGYVQQFSHEISEVQVGPGDIVLFKWGKCFSHGAIILEWNEEQRLMVHALKPIGVCRFRFDKNVRMQKIPHVYYSVW